jgi:histidine triad (HIT) family protein
MSVFVAVLIIVATTAVAVTAANRAEETVDATADYDPGNIFARILRGEAPAEIVFENEHALAFHDIAPQRAVHVLIIPKGPYTNILSFNESASDPEKLGLLDAISATARIMGVDESGFQLVSNTGRGGNQTVPHLHFHLKGGESLD